MQHFALGNESGEVTTAERTTQRAAPSAPQLGKRPRPANAFVVLGIAFALGIALAKWVDWRNHALPHE